MKTLFSKTLLVLALGAMFSTAASAREVRKSGRAGKQFRTEKRFVRCERCGKVLGRKEALRFEEAKRMHRMEPMRKAEFRRGEFGGPAFEKGKFHKFEKRKGPKRHEHR